MSVWKKASKVNQKTHKERHQPEERKHLGLLEKKKDYVKRARDYNEKRETLKLLRKRALNKNPDEFYHHMVNSKIENGMHFDKEKGDEDTPDQIKLMQTQDLRYVITKRTAEMKKIEKLQAQLHLANVDHNVRNKHIYFDKKFKEEREKEDLERLAKFELPDIDVNKLQDTVNRRKAVYKELGKRILREKELSVVQQKIEINKHLQDKRSILPPKRVRKGNKDSAPVYVWKYERKR